MRKLKLAVLLFLTSLVFLQCNKDSDRDPETIVNVVSLEPITAHINGNVVDENGGPAANVVVRVGSKMTTTDARGYFRINSAALDSKTAMVSAEKSGYFKAFRSFAATEGTNLVEIKLIKKQITGTVTASSGGAVSLSNGTKVLLPANAVVTAATGAAYTGTVNVYMSYIDPTASDISSTVPGSFMATDKDNNRVVLASYGMVAVDLETPSGEKLQIKSGSSATLTTAIPTALLAKAPSSIPLWSIDENTGIWKEEGAATKSGNVYIGQVSHFSFWNCDIPFSAIYLKMTLKTSSGQPMVHASVRLTSGLTGVTTSGFTDTLGRVSGFVPANDPLTMQVFDACQANYLTQLIGPFSANTDLGTITVGYTGPTVLTISGKLVNCNNAAVTNGYAIITGGNWTRYAATDANGNFQTTLSHCNAAFGNGYSIVGVDQTAQQQGMVVTGTISLPHTAAGNIGACGTSTVQFINYTLDGVSYSIGNNPGDSLIGYTHNQGSYYTTIQGSNVNAPNQQIDFYFNHPSMISAMYPIQSIIVRSKASALVGMPLYATITNFPIVVGQYYEGSLSGTFTETNGATHSVTATFRVRRKI